MSFNKIWTVSCDYAECPRQFSGLPVPAQDQSWELAKKAGWGRMRIGKFDQWIYLCQGHREELQRCWEPAEFVREVTDRDFSADHTIKLECGHEFTMLEGSEKEAAECPACRMKWIASGEIIGQPDLDDLLPEVP